MHKCDFARFYVDDYIFDAIDKLGVEEKYEDKFDWLLTTSNLELGLKQEVKEL